MENMLYHSAVPEATQATYGEFNNVDFVLNVGPGRSLMRNSVRLNGNVLVTNDGTTRSAGGVYMDYAIGIHSVVESCQVSFGTSGTKENIQNYARWCKMGAIGTLYEDDYNNASQQVELRAVNEVCASLLAQGEVTLGTTPVTQDLDFSMKPNCILNKMSGDHLPVEKSGEIRLTLNLARNMSCLMGDNQGADATYALSNLHVSYHSVPTQGDPMTKQTTMRSVYNIKSTILSGTANISAQVPAMVDSVSCSFQKQNEENVNVFNNYACNMVQGIRRLQFEFNDSTNKYVSYNENDLGGMIQRYIESFDNTGHQQMKLDTFRANNGFGVGQKFAGFVDLSNQRLGLQLTSDINNTKPMNIYMYFHSIVQA
tara:strand:+ start:615 stop:1724 length:1110 start_codon:yes stop_codon:yes gene_type:complete